MDEDTRALLNGAFEALSEHQEMLNLVTLVTFALRETVRELGPEAEKIYARRYEAVSNGPLKPKLDEMRAGLLRYLDRLKPLN